MEASSSETAVSVRTAPNQNERPERQLEWYEKHRSSSFSRDRRRSSGFRRPSLQKAPQAKQWWKFTLRPWDDDDEDDWWMASTAIPLLAATLGPLANVLSIAALVTYWRMCLVDNVDATTCSWDGDRASLVSELHGHTFNDPHWCYGLNLASLIMGFVGNIFLLFNFTNRVRYMIALPVTIISWYLATGIVRCFPLVVGRCCHEALMAITISMEIYVAPIRPQQTYTQGYWYAVIAAVLYCVCSMLLMVNMLGYFLGHYPQHFNLTDSQRTLILQTMLFFIWLAGGAGVFSQVESLNGNGADSWSYVNALYFCDVTILTVGFGDLYPHSDAGRGLVFPYSVGGIIMLGLMISSITKFASELGTDKVLQRHVERSRSRTIGRTVTTSLELRERERYAAGDRPTISGPIDPVDRNLTLRIVDNKEDAKHRAAHHNQLPIISGLRKAATLPLNPFRPSKKPRLILLREEKDRFDAMRKIQQDTAQWKRWYALILSVIAFGILWCIGAIVFWQAEQETQHLSYFEALYFCYVSLLTIGYGDLAPQSNAGRPFFVVWSLVAVPLMTILVADMGDTIIGNFKKGTVRLADFTVLPEKGIWHRFLLNHTWLLSCLQSHKARRAARKRLSRGFEAGPGPDAEVPLSLDALAEQERQPSDHELARKLGQAIRRVAKDLLEDPPKTYAYEEWVEFTRLIRFTSQGDVEEVEREEREQGLIEWDWIGEDSPMMARESEAEFVLDRLCESMGRYIRRLAPKEPDADDSLGQVRKDDDTIEEPSLADQVQD